jgi:hypothetical protein
MVRLPVVSDSRGNRSQNRVDAKGKDKSSEHLLIYPRLPCPTPYTSDPNLRLLLN